MRTAFAVLLLLHGVIHLPGFVKGVGLGDVPQLKTAISARDGWWWLAAAVLFVASASAWGVASRSWPWMAGAGVVISQWLIARVWTDARYGTVVNLLILVPVVLALANDRPGSLRSTYQREAARLLSRAAGTAPVITEADVAPLPPITQRFLRRAGIIGRPQVNNFQLTFEVAIRGAPTEGWIRGTAYQVESFAPPTRLFYMRASRAGVPFDGLHRYVGDSATMDIRLGGLIRVQYLAGLEMTRSETVTLLNDICLLAPAALLRAPVTWRPIDDTHVEVGLTNVGHRVSAVLEIDAEGNLVNFTSNDRSRATADGMVQRPFATPVRRLGTMADARVVIDGDATWVDDGREWTYGRFVLTSLTYNATALRRPD